MTPALIYINHRLHNIEADSAEAKSLFLIRKLLEADA